MTGGSVTAGDGAGADDPVRVGVLSLHSSKETKAICNAVDALGHEPYWLRRENTVVDITDGRVSVEPDVDVVLNRLLLSNTEHTSELLGLAEVFERTHPMANRPRQVMTALHKFAAAAAVAERGVRVPDALLALDDRRLNERRAQFGPEAVYKTAIGTHGGGTWKVGADEELSSAIGDRYAFLQEMIERDAERHSDLRVYVVDGEIVGAMRRYAPENDWRTNVALGGDVEAADPPAEAREFALEAAEAIGLDYAGVDLVEGEAGWYVLECNPTAGFRGLFRATGHSPAPYIAALGVERGGGAVDRDRVEALAAEFDDSRPHNAPSPRRVGTGERQVVGFTEEVLVSGTTGTERVVAKSDTGASRTSIDTELAAEIGAGPIRAITTVRSGSASAGQSRPVVDVVVGVAGDRHTVAASLADRSHMNYPLLLGRDVLEHYQIDLKRRSDGEGEADAEEEEEEEEERARRDTGVAREE
ncbi:MAG: ATP-grasp domain-containing protein [Halobacteriaceae archaeon]